MNNKVIYTSLTGHYDYLPQYEVIDSSFDYICFSNDYPEGSKIGQWLIKSIPTKYNNPVYASRYAKILPHLVLTKYEWSIWLDANLIIKTNEIYKIINKCIERNQLWNGIVHPRFDCIYQDIKECIIAGRITYKEGVQQKRLLEIANYPAHNGLFENNFIIRKHNNLIIKEIDNSWWEYFITYAPRDQFSLFYIFWTKSFVPDLILNSNQNTRNIESIEYIIHPKQKIIKRIINKLKRWTNLFQLKIKRYDVNWDYI